MLPPPRARSAGIAARAQSSVPRRFVWRTASISPSLICSRATYIETAALATITSRPPKFEAACATSPSTSSLLLTSPVAASAVPPAASTAVTVSERPPGETSLTTTATPWAPSATAQERPMPEPAPVTIATLPVSSGMLPRLSWPGLRVPPRPHAATPRGLPVTRRAVGHSKARSRGRRASMVRPWCRPAGSRGQPEAGTASRAAGTTVRGVESAGPVD